MAGVAAPLSLSDVEKFVHAKLFDHMSMKPNKVHSGLLLQFINSDLVYVVLLLSSRIYK
jgi:hypothetical protein